MTYPAPNKACLWVGSGLPLLVGAAMLGSAAMKLRADPQMLAMMVDKYGFAPGLMPTFAGLEVASTLLYIWPRARVLGAILLTGYLGGAMLTHLRAGEAVTVPLVLALLTWAGPALGRRDLRAVMWPPRRRR